MLHIEFVLLAALVSLAWGAADPCRTSDKTPVQSFSTRTLYDAVRGKETVKVSGKGCSPEAMWVLARNGVSYPKEVDILRFSELSQLKDSIINNQFKWGSGDICPEDLEGLRNWKLNMTVEVADRLVDPESRTIPEIARRILNKFPKFGKEMLVKYTSSKSTKESAEAFVAAIGSQPINEDLVDDKLLLKEVPSTETEETLAFREGPEMTQVYQNVSTRLGFSSLKPSVVEDMYKLCTYDRLLDEENSSPWCSLFTSEELKVLEYKEDLQSYYSSGYGSPAGNVKGCTILFDLMHRLSHYRTMARSTIYFTNDEALRNLLVSLGLRQDADPVTNDNYASSSEKSWKNSAMTPFNGNVMAVLHRCNGGLHQPETYFVTLYHNEKPVHLQWCGGVVCDLLKFVNYYTDKIVDGSCDLSAYDQEDQDPTVSIEDRAD